MKNEHDAQNVSLTFEFKEKPQQDATGFIINFLPKGAATVKQYIIPQDKITKNQLQDVINILMIKVLQSR